MDIPDSIVNHDTKILWSRLQDQPISLQPLPHPVYFVCNDPDLCEKFAHVSEMPNFEHFYRPERGGSCSWIVQTYLQLKCRGLDVRLVSQYIPDAICVVAREELMKKRLLKSLPFRSYLVVCQQDRPRPFICEHRVVQNLCNVLDEMDHFLPLWSQPDLKKRAPQRGNLVKNLVFKGRFYYLPQTYKSPAFLEQLQALGFCFFLREDYSPDIKDWMDYFEADVALAIRHTPQLYLESKPASKLINAWFAGCPALLGPEPAYQALRQSELDYIEINSPEDVLQALQQLRDEPGLYRAMVENGWRRAQDFTPEKIAGLWRNLLAGPIASGYEQWKQQSFIQKKINRPLQFTYRLMKQERERRRFNLLTGRTKLYRSK